MEQSNAKKKQIIIFGGVAAVFISAMVYSVVKITAGPEAKGPEQSNIAAISEGRVDITNPNRDLDLATPKQKEVITQYNDQQKERANETAVGGTMPLFTPTKEKLDVGVEPDNEKELAAARALEAARQARERVIYETPQKERKTYSLQQYQSNYAAYQDIMAGFIASDSTNAPRAGAAVVITAEQLVAFEQLNRPTPVPALQPGAQQDPRLVFAEQTPAQPVVEGISPGDIVYGYYRNEVNTASGVDVVVEVSSGKLKGARLVGKPVLVNKEAMIKFSSGYFNGNQIALNAAAVKPENVSALIEGNYDGQYWKRFGLPGLMAVVSGTMKAAADILKDEGTIVVTGGINGELVQTARPDVTTSEAIRKGAANGISEATGIILEGFTEDSRGARPFVTIPAQTPTAIIFFDSVRIIPNQNQPTKTTSDVGSLNNVANNVARRAVQPR